MGLDHYFKQLKDQEKLGKKEEKKLLKSAKNGNNKDKEKLLSSHLKFVIMIAKQYQNQGLTLEELIAEGNLGLVKAYNKFDISKPNNFITYAVWWIRQSIMNSIHENSKLIRLPVNKITSITKLSHIKKNLENQLGRETTDEELREHLKTKNLEKLVEDVKFSYSYVPLDAPQTANEKNLNEVIAAPMNGIQIDYNVDQFKQELELILKEFTKRERQIIYMYYGIEHPRTYTLEEIGVDLGLTRERIRQIKEKILHKLQTTRLKTRLRPFLYDTLH